MKDTAIGKIKNFGKIANIIAIIMKVILIIGMVAVIVAGIVLAVMPKDLIKLQVDSKATVVIDAEKLGGDLLKELDDMDVDQINSELKEELEAEMKLNNTEYAVASVNRDGNKLIVDTEVTAINLEFKNLLWVLGAAFISLIAAMVVAVFAGRLCKAFRDCETPFEEGIINKMKQLGYAMMPMAVLPSITDSFVNGIMAGNFDVSLNVELTVVLAIVIVFVLAYVFKYGAMLQKESDETL